MPEATRLLLPLVLSLTGLAIAVATWANRDTADWTARTRELIALAVGQVLLGALAWFVLGR